MVEETFDIKLKFKSKRARDYFNIWMMDCAGDQRFWNDMEEYADFKPNSIDDNPKGPDDFNLEYEVI